MDGVVYAVVSVNAMNGIDPALYPRMPVSFDGEDEATRLGRRARNWIPAVRFVGVDA
jgi:hypothetical protein